jgi:hypothetical protein
MPICRDSQHPFLGEVREGATGGTGEGRDVNEQDKKLAFRLAKSPGY